MTKITIISGFLGAGKTTLIKKLLTGPLRNEKTAVIENDYGDINIDGEFLKETGVRMTEIMSGCICCTLAGDFSRALVELKKSYEPDRIIIEPSGVGRLTDVVRAVETVTNDPASGMTLSSTLTVVDVTVFDMIYDGFGEFYRDQIETAGAVCLSHTDDEEADEAMIAEAFEGVRRLNRDAAIITTPIDLLGADEFLRTVDGRTGTLRDFVKISFGGMKAAPKVRAVPGGNDFDSWSAETLRSFDETEVRSYLEEMAGGPSLGEILRAKGVVPCREGGPSWIHFDLTPGHIDVRRGSPGPVGQVCVIGTRLETDELGRRFL